MFSLTLEPPSETKCVEHLVDAARTGDRSAFAALVDRERPLAFAYAYARLGSREEAEDVVQEAFVKAYLSLRSLRSGKVWQPWLMRIVRNLCHDALRRRRVRRAEPLDPAWLSREASPELQVLSNEGLQELQAAVGALPDDFRVPLVMRFGAGCSRREIAVALGVPESTVVGRLAGAMRRLRRQLREELP